MNRQRTGITDIVLIHIEDIPSSFARVEDIKDDWKKGWYHVTLLLLQIPLITVTWILRDTYIDGTEFTMDGKRIRLEKITAPETGTDKNELSESVEKKASDKTEPGKVIAFDKLKK